MIECMLFYLILLLSSSTCHGVKVDPKFVHIKTDLWQQIRNAGFHKDTSIAELEEKVSPLFTSSHVAQAGFKFLEKAGVPAATVNSFRYFRYLSLHRKNRNDVKTGANQSKRKAAKGNLAERKHRKEFLQSQGQARVRMHERARKADVAMLAEKIRRAGLGRETKPTPFLVREDALREIWSKKKFTLILSEYMRISKGILNYQTVIGKARTAERRTKLRRKSKQSWVGDEGEEDDVPGQSTAASDASSEEIVQALTPLIPDWPLSKKRSRQQVTQSRFRVKKPHPTVVAKTYKGAHSGFNDESQTLSSSSGEQSLQERPTTAGKTYRGGSAVERATVAKKEYTGPGSHPYLKTASLKLRQPQEQPRSSIRIPSPS